MINVLFVHPDEKLSFLYLGKLKEHFRTHVAVDGLSAVRKVREHAPKIVVSDYDLPFLSGIALAKFVRNYPPTAASPFIFLSKRRFDSEALNLGASDWVMQHESSPEFIIERMHYLLKINKHV